MAGASQNNRRIFIHLEKVRLSVNLHKSKFSPATVNFLCHTVGQRYVKLIIAKVEAIINYPVLTNKKQLMRFLGMIGFYRKLCKSFSAIVSPLTDLFYKK